MEGCEISIERKNQKDMIYWFWKLTVSAYEYVYEIHTDPKLMIDKKKLM